MYHDADSARGNWCCGWVCHDHGGVSIYGRDPGEWLDVKLGSGAW